MKKQTLMLCCVTACIVGSWLFLVILTAKLAHWAAPSWPLVYSPVVLPVLVSTIIGVTSLWKKE